jgi:hypothetical protein
MPLGMNAEAVREHRVLAPENRGRRKRQEYPMSEKY